MAQKKSPKKPKKKTEPDPEIICFETCTFQGRVQSQITQALARGYEFVCSPVFSGVRTPHPYRQGSLGASDYPHFLIVMKKKSSGVGCIL
jgi:hypothetical protein